MEVCNTGATKKKLTRKAATCTAIRNLKFFYTNCDSLSNKFVELEFIVKGNSPHIIIITEVAPKNNRHPLQKTEIDLDGYQLSVNDLNKEGNWGVTVYVKKCMSADQLKWRSIFRMILYGLRLT